MLKQTDFPTSRDALRATWRPIQIEPIPNSGERLTVGVVVMSASEYKIKSAPGLKLLQDVYGDRASAIVDAALLSLQNLEEFIKRNGSGSIQEFNAPFTSVMIGEERDASGDDLQTIAGNALMLSSSLSQPKAVTEPAAAQVRQSGMGRLTGAVREIVVDKRPGLKDAFNVAIKTEISKRAPRVGFLGQRTVANFNTIRPDKVTNSLHQVRTSLWILLLHKDMDVFARQAAHVIYLQRPEQDDPRWTAEQITETHDACKEVEFEAAREDILVSSKVTPDSIASDLLKRALD